MAHTSLSPNSDVTLNSGKTVADVIAIVNYTIGRMRKHWNITDTEVQDLQQDGYLAAIRADQSYDPSKSSWSHWIFTRVNGQLRTSIDRLRSFGISGIDSRHTQRLFNIAAAPIERDRDDEELDNTVEELVSDEIATDEAADTTSVVETVLGCVSERSKHILRLHYGLDGQSPPLSVVQLSKAIGLGKTQTMTSLQKAREEARECLGIVSAGTK